MFLNLNKSASELEDSDFSDNDSDDEDIITSAPLDADDEGMMQKHNSNSENNIFLTSK